MKRSEGKKSQGKKSEGKKGGGKPRAAERRDAGGARGPGAGVNAVLYAADLDDLRRWIGSKSEARFKEAWQAVRETEDSEWEPQELEVLERLLRRMVFEGKVYQGLTEEERYYQTQLLVDLFDEYADLDALSEDLPLPQILRIAESLPRESEEARLASYLARGRELNGNGVLWSAGPVEEVLSYFGYVTRDEAGRLARALQGAAERGGGKPDRVLRTLQGAAEECARAELDLVSFVGFVG